MTDGSEGLANAVRPIVVAKYLGQLLVVLVFLTVPPLLIALFTRNWSFAWRLGLMMALCLTGFGLTASIPEPRKVQRNEALVVISLVFVLAALLMTYPLMSAGLSPLDAFFESISAVTTTGLSTTRGLEEHSKSFLFTRAWMQWYGGLGIAVFSVALIGHRQIAARRLTTSENGENLMASARFHALHILSVYVILSVFGLVFLWLILGNGFTALLHVMASVSTGGFAPYDESLAAIDNRSGRLAVSGICLLGAIPLPLYYYAARKGLLEIGRDSEVIGFLAATAATSGLFFLTLFSGKDDWLEALEDALVMGISAQSTTGFASMNLLSVSSSGLFILIFGMFIGGCVNSTAGGAKILRVLIGLRQLLHALLTTALPSHAVLEPKIGDRTLHDDESIRALLLLMLFTGVIALSALIFVACGYPVLNALFEVCSATATAGLSIGITRAELEPGLKLLLCLDMLLGRLEIIAFLVVCYPFTWFEWRTTS